MWVLGFIPGHIFCPLNICPRSLYLLNKVISLPVNYIKKRFIDINFAYWGNPGKPGHRVISERPKVCVQWWRLICCQWHLGVIWVLFWSVFVFLCFIFSWKCPCKTIKTFTSYIELRILTKCMFIFCGKKLNTQWCYLENWNRSW